MQFGKPDPERVKQETQGDLKPFIHQSDLLGRQVMIVPKSIETGIPGDFGDYDRITADVLVFDGRRTESITQLPAFQANMWLSGSKIVADLKPYLPGGAKHGECLAGTWLKDKANYFAEADPAFTEQIEASKFDHYFEDGEGAVPTPDRLANPRMPQKQEPPF